MKPYYAIISLALLTSSCYRCDDVSSESESEEYSLANGCSQAECGQITERRSSHKSDGLTVQITIESTPGGDSFTYKGSPIEVTNSHDTQSPIDVNSDSGVAERRRQQGCVQGCSGSRRKTSWGILTISSNGPSPNRPSNGVSGNDRPRTKRPRVRTTTVMPDEAVGSNREAGLALYAGPSVVKEQEMVGVTEGDTPSFLPTPPNCGISLNDRIIGGTQSMIGKWPWLVAYGFKDKRTSDGEHVWMCGGSLVTEKHTITVAHCASISTFYIDVARIGDLYLNATLDERSIAEERNVLKKIIIHPNYSKKDRNHDIAIVTLKKPFSSRYKPICLPFRRDMREKNFVSSLAYVAGWGSTDYAGGTNSGVLLDVKLPIVDNAACRDYYVSKHVTIDSHHICAGGEEGKDACRGDSGGPLMLKNPGESSYFLVGVVAFGSACGLAGAPGVYTRITSYLDWLEENLQN